MAENEEANLNNSEKTSDDAVDPTHILLKNLHDLIVKNQEEQKKFNKEVLENQRSTEENFKKLCEEIQSIRAKLNKNEEKSSSESSDVENSGNPSKLSEKIVEPTSILPTTGKSFVLKQGFTHASTWEEFEECYSGAGEHFGVSWDVNVLCQDNWLVICLICGESDDEKWLIETKLELKLISNNGNHMIREIPFLFGNADENVDVVCERKFIEWEKLNKDYVDDDDEFAIEIHAHIIKMTGIYKDDLKKFDESMAKFSDVILIVKERKFYVLKLFLAANSPYFESLFLGQFQESEKSEINLSGIDEDDFQKYLEVLYGENSIDETTVEGILLVADMYDTPIVIRKCQEFLLEKSKKTLKKKLEMATRYSLEQLKNKCMSEVKTIDDIKSVLPGNIDDLDHSMMVELFKKSLELQ